jgi:isopentenyl-diphosphate delta-isomerase
MSRSTPSPIVSFEDDLLIVVDREDRVIEHRTKAECHDGDGILHRAFSVFLFDQDHRLLLTQRSGDKRLWPGFWSNSCCSHPRPGEITIEAAHRRTAEELGIEVPVLEYLYTFTYHARYDQTGSEYEMCAVFAGRNAAEPKLNPREIAGWNLMNPDELDRQLQKNPAHHSPWLHLEWAAIRKEYWQRVLAL